jgi:hypothetical protein
MRQSESDGPVIVTLPSTLRGLKTAGRWVDRHSALFLIVSVVGALLTIALIASTHTDPISVFTENAIRALTLCLPPLCAGVVILLTRRLKEPGNIIHWRGETKQTTRWRREFWRSILAHIPRRSFLLIYTAVAYLVLSFLISTALLSDGTPEIVKGGHAVVSHGKVIQWISPAEWNSKYALVIRDQCGVLLVLFTACAVFYFHRPDEKAYREHRARRRIHGAAGNGG